MANTGTVAKPLRGPDARGRRSARARPGRDGYHHGDLRAALIAAAEQELAENGVDGFTLRGCARRAGVSHAAPAHHFRDVRALFTALAAIGFRRLAETTEAFGREAPAGTIEHFTAIARGYVTFAIENPAYFRLIFRSDSLDRDDPELIAAGSAAFAVPVKAVGAYFGSADPMADPELVPLVIGLWSIVHGFSELLLSGQLKKGGPAVDRKMMVDRLLPAIVSRFVSEPLAPRRPAPESKSRRTSRRHSRSR
ncbi:MAG TPA: TetR/AcrR family transcriptional regulator [Bauldia sp.]|nr:TetR/AcrR family transcriptional regulator [Bauldia sp.]